MDKRRQRIGTVLAGIIILGMIGAAVLLAEQEIIFPEIAALATGVLLTPHLLWKDTGAGKFLSLMTVSAVLGILLTTVGDIPVYLRVVIGCVFSVVCLTVGKSGLFPMVSACVLPAIQNIQSWVYPVSVFCCALAIVIARQVMGKIVGDDGFRAVKSDLDYSTAAVVKPRVIGLGIVLLYAIIPCVSHTTLLIAPPLFVLFFELFTEPKKQRGREGQVFLLGVLCCSAGAWLTLLLQHHLGSQLLAGLAITAVLFALLRWFGMYLPPVAALSFLPMILPARMLPLYPVYTGTTLAVMCVFLRWKRGLLRKKK